MCLINPIKIDLEKDLIVYKVFRKNIFSKKLYSPYHNFEWKVNQQYSTNIDKPYIFLSITSSIEGDAFHSFKSLEDAVYLKNYLNFKHKDFFDKFVIYKCIIPKSSKYVYEGLTATSKHGGYNSYASESLIPIEILLK